MLCFVAKLLGLSSVLVHGVLTHSLILSNQPTEFNKEILCRMKLTLCEHILVILSVIRNATLFIACSFILSALKQ